MTDGPSSPEGMHHEFVRVDRRDGVALVQLDRPPMNALNQALLAELTAAADTLAADPALKAVVLAGGTRAFAAGADITEFTGPEAARLVAAAFRRATDALVRIPRPVLAAVGGYALGGGLEIALACDLRVAAADARLGQPEILLGLIPGGGGTQRLARLVGPARTKELVWTGRHVGAEEALRLGLVDRVVGPGEAVDAALAWAAELGAGAVVAMGLAKQVIDQGLDRPLREGLDLEADAFVEVFRTEDARTGVRSFLEHGPGKATFSGR